MFSPRTALGVLRCSRSLKTLRSFGDHNRCGKGLSHDVVPPRSYPGANLSAKQELAVGEVALRVDPATIRIRQDSYEPGNSDVWSNACFMPALNPPLILLGPR